MTTEGNTNAGNVFVQGPQSFDVLTWIGNNWINYPSLSLIPGYATNSNTGFGLNIVSQTVGSSNVWLGYTAGGSTVSTGTDNVVLGATTSLGGAAVTGTTMLGSHASNATGNDQIVIGHLAQANDVGHQDIVIGSYAKLTGAVAAASTASTVLIGSGSQHKGAGQSVIVGANSGNLNNTDADNTYLGYMIGQNLPGSSTVIAGNTLAGSRIDGYLGLQPQCSLVSMFGAYNSIGTNVSDYTTVCGASNTILSKNTNVLGNKNSVAGNTTGSIILGNNISVAEDHTLYLGGPGAPGAGDTLRVANACGVGGATALPGPPQGYLRVWINSAGPYAFPYWPA